MSSTGSLACVGLGMMLGAHLSPRSRACIAQADVVFALVSDPIVELWMQELRPDMRSLQPYYGDGSAIGKRRHDTYREMVEAMLVEVRAGRRVCGVFYGHPGVFAVVPHRAIAGARKEGHVAVMEPGISAEDCLYADLGIDPGCVGCQHFEAGQFLCYLRRVDPTAYLVLWQVAVVGDRSTRHFATSAPYRRLLVEALVEAGYTLEHEVIAYEAATLPIGEPRMERMPLEQFEHTELRLQTTLVIPPALALQPNHAVMARLAELDRASNGESASGLERRFG